MFEKHTYTIKLYPLASLGTHLTRTVVMHEKLPGVQKYVVTLCEDFENLGLVELITPENDTYTYLDKTWKKVEKPNDQ